MNVDIPKLLRQSCVRVRARATPLSEAGQADEQLVSVPRVRAGQGEGGEYLESSDGPHSCQSHGVVTSHQQRQQH